VGQQEEKRPLARPRPRGEDNIRMDLREIGWGGTDAIDLALDRDQWRVLVNRVINFRVLYNVKKSLNSCATGGFLTRTQLHGVR
jgi:hypothetical protein